MPSFGTAHSLFRKNSRDKHLRVLEQKKEKGQRDARIKRKQEKKENNKIIVEPKKRQQERSAERSQGKNGILLRGWRLSRKLTLKKEEKRENRKSKENHTFVTKKKEKYLEPC